MPFSFRTILLIVLPIIVGIGIVQFHNTNYGNNTNTTPPPLDYGDGNMFDLIAARYDRINRILALGMDIRWRQRMVQIILDRLLMITDDDDGNRGDTTTPTKYIVDFATGTADVALLLVKEVQKRSSTNASINMNHPVAVHIIGIDPSEQMIAIGRRKVEQQQQLSTTTTTNTNTKIDLYISDVQDLTAMKQQQQDDSNNNNNNSNSNNHRLLYDAGTMAFGIRNVPNREQALCQIHTTLKTNATLCILEFNDPSYPQDGFIGGYIVKYFIQYLIPYLGGLLSGGYAREYWHLQNSIRDFPHPPLAFGNFVTSDQRQCHNYYDATTTTTDENNTASSSVMIHGPLYQLDDIISMNFGSVQLYVFRTLPIPIQQQQQQKP